MKITLILLIVVLVSCSLTRNKNIEVSSDNLKEVVTILASDSLKGRLAGSGYDYKAAKYIEQKLIKYGFEPMFGDSGLVEFKLDRTPKLSWIYSIYGDSVTNVTYNVVMIKRAKKSDGIVVVGAHYDHMGVSKVDLPQHNQKVGDILYGANDNATGVSTMLELARLYSDNIDYMKRDMVAVSFGAEELGLLGAKEIVKKFKEEDVEIDFMFNFEMTGTLRGDSVLVLGNDSYDMTRSFAEVANPDSLIFVKEYSTSKGSDHAPFFYDATPIVCFATMGVVYYHVPQDDLSCINWDGMTKLTSYANNYFNYIMTMESLPKFTHNTK